jgi:hypothetical protein
MDYGSSSVRLHFSDEDPCGALYRVLKLHSPAISTFLWGSGGWLQKLSPMLAASSGVVPSGYCVRGSSSLLVALPLGKVDAVWFGTMVVVSAWCWRGVYIGRSVSMINVQREDWVTRYQGKVVVWERTVSLWRDSVHLGLWLERVVAME